VVVESHVLEVTLKDGCAHGVNFSQLMKLAGADVTLEAVGLANPAATPASFLRISGGSLDGLIEALKTTNNTKTLASPKLTVLNGQTAQIQIGAKLGYQTLQTTQTATMQNVNFLDTGVILKVTPIISQDNQIMLQVKPQVSDGAIDTTSGLPNSNTTEVDTKVLMADGEAIVIGGLIRESDIEIKNRIPILGDIKYVGTLFQRRSVQRQRTEIIITLLTRLVPDAPGCRQDDPSPIDRTQTPLFYGPLYRMDRRQWESEIPQGLPAYKGLTPEGGIFETYTQPPPPEMPAIPSRGSVELLPPPSFEER
jgi:type II secretory pathway component GspD/PulD (secretin)